jgi:hypothetical protein
MKDEEQNFKPQREEISSKNSIFGERIPSAQSIKKEEIQSSRFKNISFPVDSNKKDQSFLNKYS